MASIPSDLLLLPAREGAGKNARAAGPAPAQHTPFAQSLEQQLRRPGPERADAERGQIDTASSERAQRARDSRDTSAERARDERAERLRSQGADRARQDSADRARQDSADRARQDSTASEARNHGAGSARAERADAPRVDRGDRTGAGHSDGPGDKGGDGSVATAEVASSDDTGPLSVDAIEAALGKAALDLAGPELLAEPGLQNTGLSFGPGAGPLSLDGEGALALEGQGLELLQHEAPLPELRTEVAADLEAAISPLAQGLKLIVGEAGAAKTAAADARAPGGGQPLPPGPALEPGQEGELDAELELGAEAEFELKPPLLNPAANKAAAAEGGAKQPLAETLLQGLAAAKAVGAEQGYQQASGAQLVYSQGPVTGLQHSFSLQRDGAVQGQSTMQHSLSQGQWSAEVAEKVAWFSARNISSAQIRLDPPELGSLQIKIQLNQEQAQVSFSSPHASVREALDQTSLRLRELFEQQGLNLVDVSVGSEQRETGSGDDSGPAMAEGGDAELAEGGEAELQQPLRAKGLVDSYA